MNLQEIFMLAALLYLYPLATCDQGATSKPMHTCAQNNIGILVAFSDGGYAIRFCNFLNLSSLLKPFFSF